MTVMLRLVRKTGGELDVLHQEHPHEECNVDDAIDREWIDADYGVDMVGKGTARFCKHCRPEELL